MYDMTKLQNTIHVIVVAKTYLNLSLLQYQPPAAPNGYKYKQNRLEVTEKLETNEILSSNSEIESHVR